MSAKIGWFFPPNNGGQYDGFNDQGMSHYTGAPFVNLAREIIQNSLDAESKDSKGRVEVHFEKEDIKVSQIPGVNDLRDAFAKCQRRAKARGSGESENAKNFFDRGIATLKGDKISCLKISDYNTRGARGDDNTGGWFALTRARGVGADKSQTSGGSFGIGKHAAFAVSDLRTVFYYTHYTENGKARERARGRAILISHDNNGKETVGTGFYGYSESSLEKREDIPPFLRRTIKISRDEGTTVTVMGLKKPQNWRELIISAVVSNFFFAIDKGDLEVCLDSDEDGEDLIVIDSKTLPQWLGSPELQTSYPAVKDAHCYYLALKKGIQRDQTITPGFKHCVLWTKVGEGFPQGVAIVRNTGMVITDHMQHLRQWRGFEDFAAVCLCDNTEGNSLMRDMENPAHDAFSPERLDESRGEGESKKGERALKKLAEWVRSVVRDIAYTSEGKSDDIDEMAKYFHDVTASGDMLPGEEGERDFEGRSLCEIKRPPRTPTPPTPDPIGDPPFGEHEGESPGEPPSPPPGPKRKAIPVEAVRILPNPDDPDNNKSKRVRFTPLEEGEALLGVQVAGDIGTAENIAIMSAGETAVTDGYAKIKVQAGERFVIDVVLAEETTNALCIVLFGNPARGRR